MFTVYSRGCRPECRQPGLTGAQPAVPRITTTHPDNLPAALVAVGGEVAAVAVLAVKLPCPAQQLSGPTQLANIQLAFLLDEANILQRLSAAVHGAEEAARAPGPPQRRDERAPAEQACHSNLFYEI